VPRLNPQPQPLVETERNCEKLLTLVDTYRAATPSLGSGWLEVDLNPVLAGTDLIDTPSVLHRDDGVALLYPRRINLFAGETEALKTFLALLAAAQEIRKGHHVVYVDYEDSPKTAVDRLKALGVKDNDILRYFHYFYLPHPVIDAETEGLLAKSVDQNTLVTLAIFDSVTAAMVADRLDLNSSSDVTIFYGAAPRWFADRGAAVLLIDHVTKDRAGRGRYPIGASASSRGLPGPLTL
jgi:hypothetical protein